MADPKQQIIDQVRQQAALQNARALVEVGERGVHDVGRDIAYEPSADVYSAM
jgi:hypothetical protein